MKDLEQEVAEAIRETYPSDDFSSEAKAVIAVMEKRKPQSSIDALYGYDAGYNDAKIECAPLVEALESLYSFSLQFIDALPKSEETEAMSIEEMTEPLIKAQKALRKFKEGK